MNIISIILFYTVSGDAPNTKGRKSAWANQLSNTPQSWSHSCDSAQLSPAAIGA